VSDPKNSTTRYLVVVIVAFLCAGVLARWATRRDTPEDAAASQDASTAKDAAAAVLPAGPGKTFFAGAGAKAAKPVPRIVKRERMVLGAVSGTVLDPEGRTLEGAIVAARREILASDATRPEGETATARAVSKADAGRGPASVTRTARDGTYRIEGLATGTYALEARAVGLRSDALTGIAVTAGEETAGLDFVLDPGERVTGIVLDPEGKAVAGAAIEARSLGGSSIRTGKAVTGDLEGSAVSRDDGTFDMAGLTTGRLSVLARAGGFRRSEPVLVDVRAGAPEKVTLRLEAGSFIAGTVKLSTGEPAPGVRVEVRPEGGGGPPMMGGGTRADEVASATSGDDGRYKVDGLSGRRFRAVAWPETPGLAPAVRGGIAPGEQNADLTLEPAAAVYGRVVLASDKSPVEGAAVSVGDAITKKSATTDAQGRFELAPLPPSRHEVRASAAGRAESVVEVRLKAGERKEVVIELQPGCSIEGRVFAIAGGSPLPGATVRAIEVKKGEARRGGGGGGGMGRGPGEEAMVEVLSSGADLSEFMPQAELDKLMARNTVTDSRGRFLLEELPVGDYRVYAAHPEYPGNGAATTLSTPGERAKVEVGLPEGGGIAGRVVDSDNAPRQDEAVIAFSFLGKARTARTNDKGEYKMRGVAPGSYFVMLSPTIRARSGGRVNMNQAFQGMNFDSKSAMVEMGRTTEVNFGSEVKALVTGQVARGGEPVPNQGITFFPDGGFAGLKATQTGEDGRYEVELIPGKYVVRLDNQSESLEVAVGTPRIERDFRLSVGSISGRLLNAATGEPLTGGRISIYKAERKAEVESFAAALGAIAGEARVRDDGTYTVGGLAPGLYTVTGQADGFARSREDGIEVPPDAERAGVELACEPGSALRGLVVDRTREPVQGAAIVVVDASATDLPGGDPPRTDAEGKFEIKRFMPGRYRVSVITESFAPWRQFVTLTGTTADLAPVLLAGGTIEVTVKGEDGGPVPGATVDFRYPEGDRVVTGFVDFLQPNQPTTPDGMARKSRLPPGPIRVTAQVAIPGLPPQTGSADAVVVEEGETRVTVTVRGPS